ncbi:beta-glucanase precursor [mine drainage metagenome]|uniref:Beta-glucanase n=1 Tax=mine drainage metagenome TaxID=410659 RepID=A0A1J5TGS2_9ZZZZ
MKYCIAIIIVFFTAQLYGNCKDFNSDPIKKKKPKYKLVWADEFNKDGKPDSLNWSYENGFVRNEEVQWYQPENAVCKNGLLVIEAKREQKQNPFFKQNSKNWRESRPLIQYTSSCLITAKKRTWLYGRFEMRARIDVSKGMWPAWWTLGVDKHWPANGEIDIMEYYRGILLANILCLGKENKQEWHSTKTQLSSFGDSSWSAKFHVWKMDWTETSIALYVDDRLLNKVAVDSLMNKDGSGFNPFKQPHYMLVNLAIGGQNGGNPEQTSFPRLFEIDYIRVYQKIK